MSILDDILANMEATMRRLVGREPLSCERVNAFLAEYVDGTLDERTRTRFETHLRKCLNCERFMEQYRETVTIVKQDAAIDVPEEVVERTIDFLKHHYDKEA